MKLFKKLLFPMLVVAILLSIYTASNTTTAQASVKFSDFRETYSPKTGVQSPPAIIAEIETKADYDALSVEKTPSIAVYNVNDQLEIIDKSGNAITDLNNALTEIANVIPAVKITNATQKDAFISFANSTALCDAYAISEDAALIKEIAEETDVLCAIDFSDNRPAKLSDVRSICMSNGALIAILSDATEDEVSYLNVRLQSVWTNNGDSKAKILAAMNTGAQGVMTNKPSDAIDVLESIMTTTSLGKHFTIGHRGTPDYGENTVASALQAFSMGVDAVECDIMLTKDKQIILMHDTTLDRTTNGTGTVSEMTLEEIKQYTVKKSNEKVPTAREYLQALKDVEALS